MLTLLKAASQPNPDPRLPRRPFFRLLPAVLAGLAASCVHPQFSLEDPFSLMTDSVFEAGYTHITQRALEPVNLNEMAVDGMGVVSDFDAALKVARQADHVELDRGTQMLHSYALPKSEDPGDWAEVTTAVLADARAASPTVHDADPEQIYAAVFHRELAHLDHFSRYSTPAMAREQRAQRDGFGGIGIGLKQEGDEVRVETVFDDTPASKAGIQSGDTLVAVDTVPIKGSTLADVVDRLRGPLNSSVTITLASGTAHNTRDVVVRRALIIPTTVTYARNGDVGYVKITSFNQNTALRLHQVLTKAMEEQPRPRAFVLDLRDNPGGLLDQSVDAAEVFLEHGRILSTSGRHSDSNQSYDASGSDDTEGRPIAVLVNGNTASAAEVLAAALQDQGRAVLVGTVTYGKGSVQTVHRLPNDGELVITWSRIHAPSGYSFNEVGVLPNVCTSRTDRDKAGAVDAVLETVRSGRLDTAAALAVLHASPPPVKPDARVLREACPPRGSDPKLDLQVAERILADKALIASALGPATSHELAKRP